MFEPNGEPKDGMRTDKLLNYHEYLTDLSLNATAKRYGVRILPKVRVADALPINNSKISDRWFGFALRSHFDFVVVDAQTRPLFAVEYDGPSHATSRQRERDSIKDSLCDLFHLPILRVNSNHLKPQYRGLDLVTWMVEQWFLAEEFQKAQEEGVVPLDEPFDPSSFLSIQGHRHSFPLWLSLDIRTAIAQLHKEGRCWDPIPSCFVGWDEEGHCHGIGCLRIDSSAGVYAYSGAKKKAFPVKLSDLVEEVLVFEIWERLQQTLAGTEKAMPLHVIQTKVRQFRDYYKVTVGSWYGDWEP